jgi:hypothetical protein
VVLMSTLAASKENSESKSHRSVSLTREIHTCAMHLAVLHCMRACMHRRIHPIPAHIHAFTLVLHALTHSPHPCMHQRIHPIPACIDAFTPSMHSSTHSPRCGARRTDHLCPHSRGTRTVSRLLPLGRMAESTLRLGTAQSACGRVTMAHACRRLKGTLAVYLHSLWVSTARCVVAVFECACL